MFSRYLRLLAQLNIFDGKYGRMTPEEIIQIENEVFTKLVIDMLKQQRAEGKTEFLLDKYEVEKITKERLRKLLQEGA